MRRLAGGISHSIASLLPASDYAINVNHASVQEIVQGCSVTHELAEHIVAERINHGVFLSPDDLDHQYQESARRPGSDCCCGRIWTSMESDRNEEGFLANATPDPSERGSR